VARKFLLQFVGADATKAFRDPKQHVHGKAAQDLLHKFQIGYIVGKKTKADVRLAEGNIKSPADYGVDLSRGLFMQIPAVGDRYDEFVHNTLIVQSESLKLFDNPVLEALTRSPWWTVPLVWIPVTFFLFLGAINSGLPPSYVYGYILIAPVLWNFWEYLLHKFVFHMRARSTPIRVLHFSLHGYHHIAPMDRYRLTFPAVPAGILAVFVYSSFAWFLPRAFSLATMGSIVLGYVFYDLMHYYLHHGFPSEWTFFKNQRTHHLYHHYKSGDSNFGISLPLFDWVFGTYDSTMLSERKKQKAA